MMIYKHKSMKNTVLVFKIMQKVNCWIARAIYVAKYAVKSDNFQRGNFNSRNIWKSLQYEY